MSFIGANLDQIGIRTTVTRYFTGIKIESRAVHNHSTQTGATISSIPNLKLKSGKKRKLAWIWAEGEKN